MQCTVVQDTNKCLFCGFVLEGKDILFADGERSRGIEMNEVLQAIASRSSTRKYQEKPLTKEQIELLLQAGLQAPTARNQQEIHICVVNRNDAILEEIEAVKREFIVKIAGEKAKESLQNTLDNFYFNAPTIFIVSADKDFRWSKVDAGICVENMAIAAEAMGLGSLIIGSIYDALYGEKKEYFAQKLHFPENYEFAIALAVGYKDVEKTPHTFDLNKNVSFL